MREIWAMAVKDLRLLVRDRAGAFFTFVFPFAIAVFFGLIFGGAGEGDTAAMELLAVDADGTTASASFIERVDASEEIDLEVVASRDVAAERVRRGERVAYVVLEEGFGAAQENPFLGDPPSIEIGVDPARSAEAGLIEGVLAKHAADVMQETFGDTEKMKGSVASSLYAVEQAPGGSSSDLAAFLRTLHGLYEESPQALEGGLGAVDPLAVERVEVMESETGAEEPPSAYAITFPQGIIWGIISCAIGFATSITAERNSGTLQRLSLAPLGRAHILAGKAFACFVTIVFVGSALVLFGIVVFGLQPMSWVALAVALVASGVCFVGVMMLLSVFGKTEQGASGIASAALLVMAMLGGGMIPLFIMPPWMQRVSDVSPVKWSVLAIEGALWRGFSAAEMVVPILVLVGIGVVTFALGVWRFRWHPSV